MRPAAALDFARCARAWGGLAARGRIASPKRLLGAQLRFRDGTAPVVFRETVRRDVPTLDPAVIVIQFRLAVLGSSPVLHALFRRECVIHTPLFAGFPGFRSKLWADDVSTGVYAGVYEWEGAGPARHYAKRMVALLAPFSSAGSARHRVIERLRRDDFLAAGRGAADEGGGWWLLAAPVGASGQ